MTDVAGFTELMRTNEPQTLTWLKFDIEIIRRHIEVNNGEVVKIAGDGVLALFSSAAKAVRACLGAQEELAKSSLKHRMAVHAGEVTISQGDAYGDAVNVCSRLEAITVPRTVSASRIVIDLIESQGLPSPAKRGKVQLKGISTSVEVFTWGSHSIKETPRKWTTIGVGAIAAIAIGSGVLFWTRPNSSADSEGFHLPGKKPPQILVSNGQEYVDLPSVDDILDQAFDEVWQEIEEYDRVKVQAIQQVNAKKVLDWLKVNPLGQRERGKREIEHWELVDMAITKARAQIGDKATAEQVWNALKNLKDPSMQLPVKAFAEEFRGPKY